MSTNISPSDARAIPIYFTESQIARGGSTLLWMLLVLLGGFIIYISLMGLYKRNPQNVINDRIAAELFIKNVDSRFDWF